MVFSECMTDLSTTISTGDRPMRVSVVVPVFGNRETVHETCRRILTLAGASFPHLDVEIVFVDDGSPDDSWNELERVHALYPDQVRLVRLSRNFGQLSAVLAGYETAQGDAVVTLSADLQDPVGLVAQMVDLWEQGQDIVIAYRESRGDDLAATLFSRIAYGLARRANPRIPAGGFDYLLLSRRATDLLVSFRGRHRFFQGDVLWLGLPTTFLPYARERRTHGKSAWTFGKKLEYFIDLILDSSYLPIRLMSGVGITTACAGLLYAFLIVFARFQNQTPFEGWAPLMITLLIVSGLIMIMLGIIGEYLWRIYDDVKERPLYIVERELPARNSDSSTTPDILRGRCRDEA
jgi:glycosyltransferase involved in cell wall biosynthesis